MADDFRDRRDGTAGRPRLADVARLAGVSLGSASRAVRTPELVKRKTREAVAAAVEQLGYVPDGRARSLAMRKSFTIGAVLPTVNNPVYADFVQALQAELGRHGYALIVTTHEYDPEREKVAACSLAQQGIDGIVLIGNDHPDAIAPLIERAGVPFVFAWSSDNASRYTSVGFSNRRAMQQLTHYLAGLGHRAFAVLSGPTLFNERATARLEGIRDALMMNGLSLGPDHIIPGDFSPDAGARGLRRALELTPRPTALICTTDLVAIGAVAQAREMGLDVPRDLSIVGFDDIAYARFLTPALTTMRVPALEIGRQAGAAIVGAIAGKTVAPVELQAELVIRDSARPPNEAG